jgi:hypothetical protein
MNFFGYCTLVKWESQMWKGRKGNDNNGLTADDDLKSCYFTLKNPFNLPPNIFPLTAEIKHQTIRCYSGWDSHFIDISVFDDCSASTSSVIRWLHVTNELIRWNPMVYTHKKLLWDFASSPSEYPSRDRRSQQEEAKPKRAKACETLYLAIEKTTPQENLRIEVGE